LTNRPAVMGILNATPDSFANGGVPASIEAGLAMIAQGADIIDIGGESTRPHAAMVPPPLEQARVLPLIRALAGKGAEISIDTRNASTMRAALKAGASIVNDVSGLTYDSDAASVVATAGCRVILMHMRGTPQTMASLTHYDDVVADILAALTRLVDAAGRAGIARDRLVIDPGLGFAKTAAQSIAVLRRLEVFATLGLPILAGVSRKSFIGTLGGEADPQRRAPGSIAAALFAVERGASILRVHDVAQTVQALRVWTALVDSGKEDQGRGPWTPLRSSP
jgi:dihydropteroate synthase